VSRSHFVDGSFCCKGKELDMPSTKLKWFQFTHLPEKLQPVSAACFLLAKQMEESLPDGPEKSAGMRKLLEAKDCFVRAELERKAE
jgi:hypothetical protein